VASVKVSREEGGGQAVSAAGLRVGRHCGSPVWGASRPDIQTLPQRFDRCKQIMHGGAIISRTPKHAL
jgi:hypothetical protein